MERTENIAREEMVPLYAASIEDLGSGDFVKIDCAACGHTALLKSAFLARLGLEPRHRVLDLKDRVPMSGVWCSRTGRRVSQMGKDARVCEFIRTQGQIRPLPMPYR